MSNSSEKPWSDSPNAPQIPYWLHLEEKGDLAGYLISTIFYGWPAHRFIDLCSSYLSDHNPRNCHCSFLSMHERVAQSRNPKEEYRQMGICGSHHSHVLGRDDPHGDKHLFPVGFPH